MKEFLSKEDSEQESLKLNFLRRKNIVSVNIWTVDTTPHTHDNNRLFRSL